MGCNGIRSVLVNIERIFWYPLTLVRFLQGASKMLFLFTLVSANLVLVFIRRDSNMVLLDETWSKEKIRTTLGNTYVLLHFKEGSSNMGLGLNFNTRGKYDVSWFSTHPPTLNTRYRYTSAGAKPWCHSGYPSGPYLNYVRGRKVARAGGRDGHRAGVRRRQITN